jgi:hypothetical protein
MAEAKSRVARRDRRGLSRAGVVVGIIVLFLIGIVVIAVVRHGDGRQSQTDQPTTRAADTQHAATTPATQATQVASATKPAEKPPTTQYFDVVKLTYPKLPATRPLGAPLNLNDAARLVIDHPLYLSPRQDLWVTYPDAPPAEQQIKLAEKIQNDGQLTLALKDEVVYSHWRPVDRAPWTFDLVVRKADGSLEVVTSKGREPFAGKQQGYDWGRAFEWDEDVIVPTRGGIAVVRFAPEQRETAFELVKEKDGEAGGNAVPHGLGRLHRLGTAGGGEKGIQRRGEVCRGKVDRAQARRRLARPPAAAPAADGRQRDDDRRD